jgi:hypothetical protein
MGRSIAAIVLVLMFGTSTLYAQNVQDALFTVTAASAEIHKAPSTGSAVIGKAPRGKAFEVRRELGSWVSVAWPEGDGGVGYLHMTWGTITHGAAGQANRGTSAPTPGARAASEPDSSLPATQLQTPRATRISNDAPALPSHVIGLGGRIGTRRVGFAATGRAWSYGRFGGQIELGQSTYESPTVAVQVRSMQLAPSVIYAPRDLVTNAIWARPYVGAGLNIYRSRLTSSLGIPEVTSSGLGSQMFGGAELTWANLPQFALSADLRQQWAPAPFSGVELGGVGFSLSGHWYVK